MGASNYPPAVHDHRADRHLVLSPSPLRLAKSLAHEFQIFWGT
jgi:hypothetical protein